MRLLVCSDLHLNYFPDQGEEYIKSLETDVDVVVIAGDLSVGKFLPLTLQWFALHFQNSQVLYVAGNHEWYGFPEKDVENFIKQKEGNFQNLHWLNNKVYEIPFINNKGLFESKRFVGTTLWYPPNHNSVIMKNNWCDFLHIPEANRKIFKWNQKAVQFLEKEVKKNDIVITHMLPSFKSVASQFKGDPTNCFFVCDMESFIIARKPSVWIHGHTHNSFDYMLDQTRILCNPHGYPARVVGREPNPNFNPNLVIEV